MAILNRFPMPSETVWKRYNLQTMYYWDRNNTVSSTQYTWDVYTLVSTKENTTTPATFTVTAPCRLYQSVLSIDHMSGTYYLSSTYSRDCENTWDIERELNFNPTKYRIYAPYYVTSYYYTISSFTATSDTSGSASGTYTTFVTKYSRGSYIKEYTSTNSKAAPANGESGGNWYVSTGSRIVYSKGGTKYSRVSSTSRNAYPDNDKSGSYWYTYVESKQIQGAYLDEVSSDNENAYPANGIQGGYWYVKM